MIIKKHKNIQYSENKKPADCLLKHSLRICLPNYYISNYDNFNNIIADLKFQVFPCCYYSYDCNTKPLGYITIDDIKNNNVYNKLLELYNSRLYNHILPSCTLLNKNINNTDYFCNWYDAPLKKVIVSIQKSCNLKCKMCRRDLIIMKDIDKYQFDILEQLKGHNLKELALTDDGEPFLYKEKMFNFINSITTNDFKQISCISNLTLLDLNDVDNLREFVKRTEVQFFVTASIDGATAGTYKTIRNNNFFDRVMANALRLNEHKILQQINFVIQKENIHELLDAYYYWKSKNVIFLAIPINNNSANVNNDNNEIISNPIYQEYIKSKINEDLQFKQ